MFPDSEGTCSLFNVSDYATKYNDRNDVLQKRLTNLQKKEEMSLKL